MTVDWLAGWFGRRKTALLARVLVEQQMRRQDEARMKQ